MLSQRVRAMTEQRFSEAEAKKLLDRATELDAERGHSLDPAAVRQIALEAGISPAAIDAAVAEHLEGRNHPAKSRKVLSGAALFVRVAAYVTLGWIVLLILGRLIVF